MLEGFYVTLFYFLVSFFKYITRPDKAKWPRGSISQRANIDRNFKSIVPAKQSVMSQNCGNIGFRKPFYVVILTILRQVLVHNAKTEYQNRFLLLRYEQSCDTNFDVTNSQ